MRGCGAQEQTGALRGQRAAVYDDSRCAAHAVDRSLQLRGANLDLGASPPSAAHWLGTDIFGRDVLTQIMYGGRISLAVGFIATAVALLIGVTWGAVAGYVGGRVDAVMMRLVDILYALPFMIFIVLLMVVFGRNILLLFLAIGAVEWLTMARIMRSQVQCAAAGVCRGGGVSGLSPAAIIRKHVVPNALGPIIVYTTLTIPSVMLLEAFLSFLGWAYSRRQPRGVCSSAMALKPWRSIRGSYLPRLCTHAHTVFSQLSRRRPARCAGRARLQGLNRGTT